MPTKEMTGRDHYISAFAAVEPSLRESGPDWLHSIRKQALDCFASHGFPTTRDEDWKYTNLGGLASQPFQPAPAVKNGVNGKTISAAALTGENATRLVFVNGKYRPDLSSSDSLRAPGAIGMSLKSALADRGELVREHLARHANFRQTPLAALNTAFIEDGAFVYVPPGTAIREPVYLVFLSSPGSEATFSQPRTLVIADDRSQVAVVEQYIGLAGGSYFTNAVTEIAISNGARVDHYKVEREQETAFHVATVQVHQQRNSSFSSYSASLGGGLVRNDINALMGQEGSDCALWGLYLASGKQHVDNHTIIDHAAPSCASRELFHGVLTGHATGVFNGKVVVRPEAQKTTARQANRNLLLSQEALINTKPQLEIFADDVKCTHAATVGRLDENALFYLCSRGIQNQVARQMLVKAFAGEVLKGIRVDGLRSRLADLLSAVLASNSWVEEIR